MTAPGKRDLDPEGGDERDPLVLRIARAILTGDLTPEELEMLAKVVHQRHSAALQFLDRGVAAVLRPGMRVEWEGREGRQRGTILEVKRTRVVVDAGGVRWRVAASMLRPAEDQASPEASPFDEADDLEKYPQWDTVNEEPVGLPPPPDPAPPRRNRPCPCGSGRKFKKCCGRR